MKCGWVSIAALVALLAGCRAASTGLPPGIQRESTPPRLSELLRLPPVDCRSYCQCDSQPRPSGTNVQDGAKNHGGAHAVTDRRRRDSQRENTATSEVRLTTALLPVDDSRPDPVETVPASLRLSLDDAMAMTLRRNPDLIALRAGEPVAHAAFHVAETYPFNPQFQTQVLPYTRDRIGNDAPVSQQHVIVQTFELAHQRQFRVEAAWADWGRVSGTIRAAEVASVVQTARLFFAALYQRALRDQARSLATLNQELIGVIERRFQAGQSNAADVALARLEAQLVLRQLELAEAQYQAALMSLRNQLNLDTATTVELTGELTDWQWQPLEAAFGLDTAEASLDESRPSAKASVIEGTESGPMPRIDDALLWPLIVLRPDVEAALAAVEAARANLGLAEAARTPDVQIGPMYQRDDAATEFWGVQAQVDIPVVNTGVPLVWQRTAELRLQAIAAAQLERKALSEARTAVARYERARRLAAGARAEYERPPDDVLRPVEDQFKAGQIDLLRVFAARTSFAQARRSHLDLLNELGQAAAGVMQALVIPPQALTSGSETSTSASPALSHGPPSSAASRSRDTDDAPAIEELPPP